MTTILADFHLGVMVSDSCVSDGDRVWKERKIFKHKGSILGFAGVQNEWVAFLAWWKEGCTGKAPKFSAMQALVLSSSGLIGYSGSPVAVPITSGIAAIGTGGKSAMCAYDALGNMDPARAVAIVCKYDLNSRKPVRTYRL